MPSQTARKELLNTFMLTTMMQEVLSPPETIEEAMVNFQQTMEFISLIENSRYLRDRPPVPKQGNINLAWDFAANPSHHQRFLNMLRISPVVFEKLLSLIENHEVFQTDSNHGQAPVELQLAVTLYRMGCFGNGASVEDIARVAGCSEGSVQNFTNRCFKAILSLHDQFVRQLTPEEKEVEKVYMDNHLGFKGLWREGWVMYDGTIVVLFRKPGKDGDAYYTRKANYGLNVQVPSTILHFIICKLICLWF